MREVPADQAGTVAVRSWWNGIHSRLWSGRSRGHVGSNPTERISV
jgi:hypothetical protein